MNILNLPAWSVLDTREADHDYHITVQLNYPPSHCPHCGVVANLQGYGGKEQLFLDLPIQLKTYYDELGKASALFHSWTYQKGGVLVQLNGELDQATADKYGAVVAGL